MQREYSRIFNEVAENNEYLQMAVEIVRSNSEGQVYLIGGFIYRLIAGALYEGVATPTDIDFIVTGRLNDTLCVPRGCSMNTNSYGCPKFTIKDNYTVDLSSLVGRESLRRRGLEESIPNLLTALPLEIQSIAYDFTSQLVIGEIGMAAIGSKVVKVHDRHQALTYSLRKKKPINRIIMEKALSMGFTPVID